MQGLPMIRLEVEGMRYAIVHAFSTQMDGVQEYIEESLKNMDIGKVVVAQVEQQVPRLVEEAVKQAIKDTLYATMRDEQVRTILDEQVRRAVFAMLQEK